MMKFERYDDAVYAHTDYVKWFRENGTEVGGYWLADRDNKYGETAAVPSAWAWRHGLIDALDTDILWMTTEMMDLVQSAMVDFDMEEKVTLDDIFIPSGFMVLPHSFLSMDANGLTMGWRILYWKTVEDMVVWPNDSTYSYDTSLEGEREHGVRFMQVSYVADEDDWSRENEELHQALIRNGENWGIAHATSIPFRFLSSREEIKGEGDHDGSWLRFWRVAQKLMSERIVLSERRHPSRPARREAQRYLLPPPILRVIELRRPRGEREEEGTENGGGRKYTHRWIVRGHWRNQPYKTGYKQIFISAYEKGPEDLDLIVKQRVWNWDR